MQLFNFNSKFCKKTFMQKRFDFIEHTADIGIKVYGKTLEELFTNAAYGMYNLICENFHKVEPKKTYNSVVESSDYESLLVSFLNDLIFQTFVNRQVFCNFKIKMLEKKHDSTVLSYECSGEDYDKTKHGVLFELKSATYHNLKILTSADGNFEVSIIFDT